MTILAGITVAVQFGKNYFQLYTTLVGHLHFRLCNVLHQCQQYCWQATHCGRTQLAFDNWPVHRAPDIAVSIACWTVYPLVASCSRPLADPSLGLMGSLRDRLCRTSAQMSDACMPTHAASKTSSRLQALLSIATGDPAWDSQLKSVLVWSTFVSGFVVWSGINSVSSLARATRYR